MRVSLFASLGALAAAAGLATAQTPDPPPLPAQPYNPVAPTPPPPAPGVRVVAGAWLDRCQTVGVEADWFLLDRRTSGFAIQGGGPFGIPALAIPFNAVGPGPVTGETAAAIAGPFAGGILQGAVAV